MTRSGPIHLLASAAVIPLVALAVAACGGGGAATAATPKTSTGASATIGVAKTSLGSTLVKLHRPNPVPVQGRRRHQELACTGACVTAWAPLLASGKPTAGTGLTALKLGTITRSGGSQQVTYNGHPVYQFIKDQKPGQTTGQGVTAFGAAWFALSPSGSQISATPPSPATGRSSGGGGY
jgi:predicted lipoprotein with Yx(FWY)xxD motif